jgi:hypothetical protein
MSDLLKLPPEIVERLQREAQRLGKPDDEVAISVLNRYLPQPLIPRHKDPKKLLELIDQWAKEDEQLTDEELEANAQVLRNIDAERPEGQKLFTEVLKPESE